MLESVPDSLGSQPPSPHLYNQCYESVVVKVNGEGSRVFTGGMRGRRAILGRQGPGSWVRGGGGEAEGGQGPAAQKPALTGRASHHVVFFLQVTNDSLKDPLCLNLLC